jgi:hypothetical protein
LRHASPRKMSFGDYSAVEPRREQFQLRRHYARKNHLSDDSGEANAIMQHRSPAHRADTLALI